MIIPVVLVCSSLLIVCMFTVSKVLLILNATVIVRTWGAISLNPIATVLFGMCSAVTSDACDVYTYCVGVLVSFLLCKEEGCMRCPRLCWDYVSSFKHTREECESNRVYLF